MQVHDVNSATTAYPTYPTYYSQWAKKPEPPIAAPSTINSALSTQTDSESESAQEAVPQAQFKRRNFVCAITVGGARRAPGNAACK